MTTDTAVPDTVRRLVLIRHAEAEDLRSAHAAGRDEATRCLTPAGESNADALGRLLQARVGALTGIATSPLQRARQTADRVATATGAGEPCVLETLEPGGGLAGLLTWLDAQPGGVTLAMVGHAPDIGGYAASLAGRPAHRAPSVPPAGALLLELPLASAPAQLLWSQPAGLRRSLLAE